MLNVANKTPLHYLEMCFIYVFIHFSMCEVVWEKCNEEVKYIVSNIGNYAIFDSEWNDLS